MHTIMLDDQIIRCTHIEKNLQHKELRPLLFTTVTGFTQYVAATLTTIDVILLDHDLELGETGMEVVTWFEDQHANSSKLDDLFAHAKVIVHSHNTPAARRMVAALDQIFEEMVMQIPYDGKLLAGILESLADTPL